jgi:hypothetical protein
LAVFYRWQIEEGNWAKIFGSLPEVKMVLSFIEEAVDEYLRLIGKNEVGGNSSAGKENNPLLIDFQIHTLPFRRLLPQGHGF